MDVVDQNLQEIRRTNQRGGRCLSIIDLIEAGTLSSEMASLCWMFIGKGHSFITGAVPGGAGKTTLMAALLAFLPSDEQIVTARDYATVEQAADRQFDRPISLLAHEIGQGPWFAYIWGRTAREFFACNGPGQRPVTCLHADTPRQTTDILRECGVAPEDIDAIGMHLYIRAFGSRSPHRRVTALHCRLDGRLLPVYRWLEDRQTHERLVDRPALAAEAVAHCGRSREDFLQRWDALCAHLQELRREGVHRMEKVYRRNQLFDVESDRGGHGQGS
jgi:hypothetical protein